MYDTEKGKPIKEWAREDRPREKMLFQSASILSDAELLAILIGSGCGRLSALDLAKKILHESQNNLGLVIGLSPKELISKFKGIGEAKAARIAAGIELGKRAVTTTPHERPKICSSTDAFNVLFCDLSNAPYEKFLALFLSRSNHVLRKVTISEGGLSSTVVDPKKLFKLALEEKCSGLILAHNHPSGNLSPSKEDTLLTNQLCKAAILLDLRILDHLIIAENNYFSFADNMMIPSSL